MFILEYYRLAQLKNVTLLSISTPDIIHHVFIYILWNVSFHVHICMDYWSITFRNGAKAMWIYIQLYDSLNWFFFSFSTYWISSSLSVFWSVWTCFVFHCSTSNLEWNGSCQLATTWYTMDLNLCIWLSFVGLVFFFLNFIRLLFCWFGKQLSISFTKLWKPDICMDVL